MKLRPGNEHDLHKVGRLWVDMMHEIFPEREPDLAAWKQNVQRFLLLKGYYLFVVEEGGKMIGFTDFIIQYDPTISKKVLNSFHTFVIKENRKSGATNLLWSEVVKGAKDNQCHLIMFSTTPNLQKYWETIQSGILSEVTMTIDVSAIREV
jgi:hypothetical protein